MGIVGFTIYFSLDDVREQNALQAQARALAHFPQLQSLSIELGGSKIHVWGHAGLSERIHSLPDGSLLVLVGSPHGKVSWHELVDRLARLEKPEDLDLPWEGRIILLKVNPEGTEWMLWNDWLGSIPVFYSQVPGCQIASTVEPVVVSAASLTSEDIFLPGLVTMFINGHLLADWTLFKQMKVIPPDSVSIWNHQGYRSISLNTLAPGENGCGDGWDDLVDGMYELSKTAILKALQDQPRWIIPLSSGLDSRLIAAVGAEAGMRMKAYSWGSRNATDVIYAEKIAKTLNIPWKWVNIGTNYLTRFTRPWADLFGSSMHFHGMYQMSFLDAIKNEPAGPVVSGFLGDVLAGDGLVESIRVHQIPENTTIDGENYAHWYDRELLILFRKPIQEAIIELAQEIKRTVDFLPGARYQKLTLLELRSRQRYFTSFSPVLNDYGRGVATPFIDRNYARFCINLPRTALDHRRLLGDVFRRYYGKLAVIGGTYSHEPYVRTGRYLLMNRLARISPGWVRRSILRGHEHIPLHMDADSIAASGRDSIWPIDNTWTRLSEWVDVDQLTAVYRAVLASNEDIRPVRKLQSVQALAYSLMNS